MKLATPEAMMSQTPSGSPSKPPLKDFTDLEVWKAAREMRRRIYKVAETLPDFEKIGLANQLRRAATSITANLAEGFGRYGYQENAQFCRQARGSAYELSDHLITCMDEQFLREDEALELDAMAQGVTMMLNGYLRSTLARKQTSSQ